MPSNHPPERPDKKRSFTSNVGNDEVADQTRPILPDGDDDELVFQDGEVPLRVYVPLDCDDRALSAYTVFVRPALTKGAVRSMNRRFVKGGLEPIFGENLSTSYDVESSAAEASPRRAGAGLVLRTLLSFGHHRPPE